MGDLICTKVPIFTDNIYMENLPKLKVSKPNWANEIEQSDLIKSLTKYGEVYANDSYYPTLPKIGGHDAFSEFYTLHLAFKEPFDEYKSMSIIEISGYGQTKLFARENLVKRVNNLWQYEDLLLHCYCSDLTPYNKYCYSIFDPKEVQRHNLMQNTQEFVSFPAKRAPLNLCGRIYTNAFFPFLGRSR